ncbi:MAG: hypothetical protein WC479_08945 [Candidatus Izemoplasmatales bacterium]|jgi:hypothetical protein
MPQHGPDLFSSDIGSIMRDEYKNFLAFNYEPKDVLVIFKKYFLHDSSSKRDKDLFWLIMARMQVNYGCLLDEVRDKALMVIESGDDIKQWEEYVFIEKHISSYQVITNELIQKNLLKDVDNIQERAQTFLEEFHKLQDEKLTEYLQDDHLPEEVLRYFNEKGFSKIEIFGNDGKKYLKKRIEVIETLEKDIANFEPSKKKFSKPYSFDPEWKIGDVYAYKLVEEEDQYGWIKDVNFYDKYILFEVVGIDRKAISRILPSLAVRTEVCVKSYIFIDDTLPNISELDNLEYLSMRRIRYKDNIEKLGKFIKDKEAIFFVIFYGETKKIKKMQLIKLKEGYKTESDVKINNVGYSNVFISHLPYSIANDLKHYLDENRNFS